MKVVKRIKVFSVKFKGYDLVNKKLVDLECNVKPSRGKIEKALELWCKGQNIKLIEILSSDQEEKVYSMSLEKFIENAEEVK